MVSQTSAFRGGDLDVITTLVETGDKGELLDVFVNLLLVEKGMDVIPAPSEEDFMPWDMSAFGCNLYIVKALLAVGADVNR